MLRRRSDDKKILLFTLVGFFAIAIALTSYFVFSEESLDDRSLADGEEDIHRALNDPVDYILPPQDVAISLEPSTGTISASNFKIDLIVDTYGEEVLGIDVDLEYSGDIEYVKFEQGNIENCSVLDTHSVGFLNLTCFIDPAQQQYQGQGDAFASVIFKATDDGSADVNVSIVTFGVSDERNELNFHGGSGEYTTTSEILDSQPSCGTLNNQTFTHQTTSWSQGTFCSEGISEPTNPSFPDAGSTTSWSCLVGTQSVSCSAQREAAPPSCGTLDGQTFTYETTTWPTGSFCLEGNASPASPDFPEAGSRTSWQCTTISESTSCSASRYSTPFKEDGLPETSIFNNAGVLLGFALVLVSGILLVYRSRDGQESFSMRSKLSL